MVYTWGNDFVYIYIHLYRGDQPIKINYVVKVGGGVPIHRKSPYILKLEGRA